MRSSPNAPEAAHEPHRIPAACPQGQRRPPDFRHSRRFRAAVFPHHRRDADPAALHALARARGRLRGRCGGAHRWRAGGCGGDLRRRGAEHDQLGGGGLCREVAAGGDLGRSGQGRVEFRPAAAPSGEDAGFAVPHLRGDHLRPRPPRRRRARAGRHCPRAGQLPAKHSRPVYIEIPRDMVAVPCAAVPPLARAGGGCRGAGSLRRRGAAAAGRPSGRC